MIDSRQIKPRTVIPRGIPRVTSEAWYSLRDICQAWTTPTNIQVEAARLLRQRNLGFSIGDDHFACGESIVFAIRDASRAAVRGVPHAR